MAFYSLALKPGDAVLTSMTEYAGNYIPYLQLRQRRGIEIRIIPNDEHGQVCLAALAAMLEDERVALVSLPMIATNGGPVQPVEQIGALARAAGVLFLLDACQGVGQVPIDVQKIGCHMLAATSRKYLRGPRGRGGSCTVGTIPVPTPGAGFFWTCMRRPCSRQTALKFVRMRDALKIGNATLRPSWAWGPQRSMRWRRVSNRYGSASSTWRVTYAID